MELYSPEDITTCSQISWKVAEEYWQEELAQFPLNVDFLNEVVMMVESSCNVAYAVEAFTHASSSSQFIQTVSGEELVDMLSKPATYVPTSRFCYMYQLAKKQFQQEYAVSGSLSTEAKAALIKLKMMRFREEFLFERKQATLLRDYLNDELEIDMQERAAHAVPPPTSHKRKDSKTGSKDSNKLSKDKDKSDKNDKKGKKGKKSISVSDEPVLKPMSSKELRKQMIENISVKKRNVLRDAFLTRKHCYMLKSNTKFYFVIHNIYDKDLIDELAKLGITVSGLIEIASNATDTRRKAVGHIEECQMQLFWEGWGSDNFQLRSVLPEKTCFLRYFAASRPNIAASDLERVMYNVMDLKRQFNNYLNNTCMLNFPVYKHKPMHCFPTYNRMLRKIPNECITISIMLNCIIEEVSFRCDKRHRTSPMKKALDPYTSHEIPKDRIKAIFDKHKPGLKKPKYAKQTLLPYGNVAKYTFYTLPFEDTLCNCELNYAKNIPPILKFLDIEPSKTQTTDKQLLDYRFHNWSEYVRDLRPITLKLCIYSYLFTTGGFSKIFVGSKEKITTNIQKLMFDDYKPYNQNKDTLIVSLVPKSINYPTYSLKYTDPEHPDWFQSCTNLITEPCSLTESYDSNTMIQMVNRAYDQYQHYDYKYFEPDDVILLRFHHETDRFGVKITRSDTPMMSLYCFRDFCAYVLPTYADWFIEKEQDYWKAQKFEVLEKDYVCNQYEKTVYNKKDFIIKDSLKWKELHPHPVAAGKKGQKDKRDITKTNAAKLEKTEKTGKAGKKGKLVVVPTVDCLLNVPQMPIHVKPKELLFPVTLLKKPHRNNKYFFEGYNIGTIPYHVQSKSVEFVSTDGISVTVDKYRWTSDYFNYSIKASSNNQNIVFNFQMTDDTLNCPEGFAFHVNIPNGINMSFGSYDVPIKRKARRRQSQPTKFKPRSYKTPSKSKSTSKFSYAGEQTHDDLLSDISMENYRLVPKKGKINITPSLRYHDDSTSFISVDPVHIDNYPKASVNKSGLLPKAILKQLPIMSTNTRDSDFDSPKSKLQYLATTEALHTKFVTPPESPESNWLSPPRKSMLRSESSGRLQKSRTSKTSALKETPNVSTYTCEIEFESPKSKLEYLPRIEESENSMVAPVDKTLPEWRKSMTDSKPSVHLLKLGLQPVTIAKGSTNTDSLKSKFEYFATTELLPPTFFSPPESQETDWLSPPARSVLPVRESFVIYPDCPMTGSSILSIKGKKMVAEGMKNIIKDKIPGFKIVSSSLHKRLYVKRIKSRVCFPMMKRFIRAKPKLFVRKHLTKPRTLGFSTEPNRYNFMGEINGRVTLPTGLAIDIVPNNLYIPSYVKQRYIIQRNEFEPVHEHTRCYLRNGKVLKFMNDNSLITYSPELSLTRINLLSSDDIKACPKPLKRKMSTMLRPYFACVKKLNAYQRLTRQLCRRYKKHMIDLGDNYQNKPSHGKKYTLKRLYSLYSILKMDEGNYIPQSDFEATTSTGENYVIKNNKVYFKQKYISLANQDYIYKDEIIRREDGTTFMVKRNGAMVVQFPDDTRITTWYVILDENFLIDGPKCNGEQNDEHEYCDDYDYLISMLGERNIIEEPYVLVGINYKFEHPYFAPVVYDCLSRNADILLPDTLKIIYSPLGSYHISLLQNDTLDVTCEQVEFSVQTCNICESKTACNFNIYPFMANRKKHDLKSMPFLNMEDSEGKTFEVYFDGTIRRYCDKERPYCARFCCEPTEVVNDERLFVLERSLSGHELSRIPQINRFRDTLTHLDPHDPITEIKDVSTITKSLYRTFTEHFMNLYETPVLYMNCEKELLKHLWTLGDTGLYPYLARRKPIFMLQRVTELIPIERILDGILHGIITIGMSDVESEFDYEAEARRRAEAARRRLRKKKEYEILHARYFKQLYGFAWTLVSVSAERAIDIIMAKHISHHGSRRSSISKNDISSHGNLTENNSLVNIDVCEGAKHYTSKAPTPSASHLSKYPAISKKITGSNILHMVSKEYFHSNNDF